jgi:aminotransferase
MSTSETLNRNPDPDSSEATPPQCAMNDDRAWGVSLSPIKAMELAAARLPGAISLAQGIPNFPTPMVIKDFVAERLREGACDRYSLTTGLPELRNEIARTLASDGLAYDAESEIIVTAGAIGGIAATLLAVTEPGDEVIVPSPSYASYLGCIRMARCIPQYVELDEQRGFELSEERLTAAISPRTRAIILCNPNNPTGTIFSEAHLRSFVSIAMRHDIVVIMDEVYRGLHYSYQTPWTPAVMPEARHHIVHVCSFSKAFAMTGWRVGFLHADRSLVDRILPCHDAMITCAPVISQYAALAALRYGDTVTEEFRREFLVRRDCVVSMLEELRGVLEYQIPAATYFLFPRIHGDIPLAHDSTKLAYDILQRARVAVVPGVAFGPSGESHLRISFGCEPERLVEGIGRLISYFRGSVGAGTF